MHAQTCFLLGLSSISPVHIAVLKFQRRKRNPDDRVILLWPARLKEQDWNIRVLGQSGGENTTRRPCSHYKQILEYLFNKETVLKKLRKIIKGEK